MARIAELAQWLRERDHIAVIPHVNPDGDALGSALSLKLMLDRMGKRACICSQDGVPTCTAGCKEWCFRRTNCPLSPRRCCSRTWPPLSGRGTGAPSAAG